MKTIKLNKDSYGNKFVGLENEINKFHFDIFKYATNDYTIIISVYGLKRKNENMCAMGYHEVYNSIGVENLTDAKKEIINFMFSDRSTKKYFDEKNNLIN